MFPISLAIYPGVELLGHRVVLLLVLLRNLHTVSIVTASTYTPTNSVPGFPYLHIHTNICSCRLSMTAILTRVKFYLSVVLIGISVVISNIDHLLTCLLDLWSLLRKKWLFRSSNLSSHHVAYLIFWQEVARWQNRSTWAHPFLQKTSKSQLTAEQSSTKKITGTYQERFPTYKDKEATMSW